ncbi:MAG TPA: hypothetical protein VJN01_09185 [Xanthomonadales bacterium]|nr:hypothetical protein [Xanthomonadales bacterium]
MKHSKTLLCLSIIWSGEALAQRVGDFCMETVWSEHNLQSLQCTATDIDILSVNAMNIIEDCASGEFQSASVEVQVQVLAIPDLRWDIGFFVALDGPSATAGNLCLHDFLPQPATGLTFSGSSTFDIPQGQPDGPWSDFDGDACGDVEQGDFLKTLSLEFVCRDDNQNGTVEVAYCTSWRQEDNQEVCSSVADTFPGAPSKCHCDELELPMPPAYLLFNKATATPEVAPGNPVTFTITAQSAGVEDLENVGLTDPDCGLLSPVSGNDADEVLEAGETWSWTCTVDAVTADLVNSATLTATTVTSQMPVELVASAEVKVITTIFVDGFELLFP